MLPRLVSGWTRWPNWLFCEMAIGACDLAEVLGSAVALNLMFHIPLLWAVIITGLDVLLLLALQRFGMRTIEAVVLLLVATIGVCYFIEIFVLPQMQPEFLEMGRGLITPSLRQAGNDLHGHRHHRGDGHAAQSCTCIRPWCKAASCRRTKPPSAAPFALTPLIPSPALTVAFFVNAAIMVLAALVFLRQDQRDGGGRAVVTFSAGQRLDSHRVSDAGAACWERRRRAPCLSWRCWPAARAAPSPARWPGRW